MPHELNGAVMRRLVSPFILGKLAEDDHGGSLEAATLFVDTAGFTTMMGALTEHGQYGAEVAAQVMSALWAPLVEAVYAQGGVITVFAGDGFTAMFPSGGADVDESCMLRALAAAHAMRQQMLTHSRHDTPWGAFDLSVKIGLAAGTVQWRFVTQLVGERSFKGFAGPQEVFGLTDRRDAGNRRFGGEMVGRHAELQALTAFVGPVHAGDFAGALVVHGEPGMGKSRLISEFLESVEADVPTTADDPPRLRALTAPADSIARTPFHPFRYLLRNYFASNPRAPESENKAVFDERLDALFAHLPDEVLRRELQRLRVGLPPGGRRRAATCGRLSRQGWHPGRHGVRQRDCSQPVDTSVGPHARRRRGRALSAVVGA